MLRPTGEKGRDADRRGTPVSENFTLLEGVGQNQHEQVPEEGGHGFPPPEKFLFWKKGALLDQKGARP